MPELMKGKCWLDRKDATDRKGAPIVTYPVVVETKHDEIRCHVQVLDHPEAGRQVHFISYSGKPLANMQQFASIFQNAPAIAGGYTEFDCGFEVNGNFNDSYRWVRSTNGIPDNLKAAKHKFYLYDLPENTDMYWNRRPMLVAVAHDLGIEHVSGVLAYNEQEVEALFLERRAQGHEGIMVKLPSHKYQRGKRIDGWLKYKPEMDADGYITAINEAVSLAGEPLGRAGSVQLVLEDGSKAAPSGIPFALGLDMWRNPVEYIGQLCEFKYMERDRQGGYRHPVFHRIRES